MDKLALFLTLTITLSSSSSLTSAATASPPPFLPPAPAPSPSPVNLTHLLTVAGPFHTFLKYLQQTDVITTFQNQANITRSPNTPGITIFVPKDSAFSSLKSPSLSNLTSNQLRSLCLFHALPQYYSISDFRSLSLRNPITTFAGGEYTLSFTDNAGTVHITSQWTHTKISSSVISTEPVALYEVDKVLLPVAIFGTDIPPSAAPAPAPEGMLPDSPSSNTNKTDDHSSALSPSSAPTFAGSTVVAALVGLLL